MCEFINLFHVEFWFFHLLFFVIKKHFKFILTEYKWGRGRERGRERIPSRLRTVCTEPHAGLELTNQEIMT